MDIITSGQFNRDIKKCTKQGRDMKAIKAIISKLATPEQLPQKNRPHKLTGDYIGWTECHISPDWLLIYRYNVNTLELFRTGTHSELFGK